MRCTPAPTRRVFWMVWRSCRDDYLLARNASEARSDGRLERALDLDHRTDYRLPAFPDTPASTSLTKVSSGTAPRISTSLPSTIVLGTPVTRYFCARSMNSVASTHVARMCGFSTAMRWASVTARGQWGHVGVTKTLMWGAPVPVPAFPARFSGVTPASPVPASTTASTSDMNS